MIPGYGPDNDLDTAGFPGYAEINIQNIRWAEKYALDYDLASQWGQNHDPNHIWRPKVWFGY